MMKDPWKNSCAVQLPRDAALSALQGGSPRLAGGQSAGPSNMGPEPELVHEPGGDIVSGFVHPAFTIFERVYRVLPEEGFYSAGVSSTRPIQFELGSFAVPSSMHLWLFDYEFSVYRQSGIDPGDIVKAEDGRFSGFMGFDVQLNSRRDANIAYELDPHAIQLQRTAFSGAGPASADQFNRAQANSFAANASAGTSLLPVRPQRMGARDVPFTFIVWADTRVALSCVIFRQVTTPIAAIEGRIGGYLIEDQASSALVNRLRPR